MEFNVPLPTKTDAVFVRPTSIQVPEGKTELRHLRTENSKTHLHAEKSHDGKEICTCEVRMGAVCYRDDDGQLRSIDTTIRDLDGEVGIDWAPYRFRLHSEGIGFDFHSREGGWVGITLTGIGGEKFDQDTPLTPDIVDNTITFRDVRPGCDIVFKCLNQRVKTLRILRDANAPRTFEWTAASDKPELIDSTLFGTDAAGNQLELSSVTNGSVVTETWSGKAKVILDPATRIRSWGTDVAWPLTIDPTVNTSIATGLDDGEEAVGSSWTGNSTYLSLGRNAVRNLNIGLHFATVNIPQGSTITSATLTMLCNFVYNGGSGKIYGEAADNPAQFSSGKLPSGVSRTTANTATGLVTSTGSKVYTITSVIQEIVNRAGFVANNAVNLPIIGLDGTYRVTRFDSYETSGSNQPAISVTYTEPAAGGTAGKPLMLLGCG